MLSDVCDVDEKMNDVLRWSKEQAKGFTETYKDWQVQHANSRNDDNFVKKLKESISEELKSTEQQMGTVQRTQKYAIQVKEKMAKQDQDTLSKYILRLEDKITQKMKEKHALLTDVYHLRAEAEKMRYTDEDMKRIADE